MNTSNVASVPLQMVSKYPKVPMSPSSPMLSTVTSGTSRSLRSFGLTASCQRIQWEDPRMHTSPSLQDYATVSVRTGLGAVCVQEFWLTSLPLACLWNVPQVSGLQWWRRRWFWRTFCATSTSKRVTHAKRCSRWASLFCDQRRGSGSNWKRGPRRIPQTAAVGFISDFLIITV